MNNVDIIFNDEREDFKSVETGVFKGQNICSVQLGSLWGGQDIGIDFASFVKGDLEFSVKTFKAHILNQLTILNCTVNKIDVIENDVDGMLKIGVR